MEHYPIKSGIIKYHNIAYKLGHYTIKTDIICNYLLPNSTDQHWNPVTKNINVLQPENEDSS